MIKVGGVLGKIGKAVSSPAGRATVGTALGGPIGGITGFLSSKEGREKAQAGVDNLGKKIGDPMPKMQGEPERAQAQTLAQAVAGQYSNVAQQGIQSAQQMQAPTITGAHPAVMPGQGDFRAPTIQAPTLGTSQAAQAAQMGAAPSVAGGFAEYLAGLTPEQIQAAQIQQTTPVQAAQLERTSAAEAAQLAQTQAVQAAQLERTGAAGPAQLQVEGEARTFQQALAQQLMGQATGTAPSLAEQQLKVAQDRALRQQMAQAASVRGAPGAAAQQRQLGTQLAETQQAQLAQSTEARIQEQQAAQQTLAGVAQGMRATDVDVAKAAAQLEQQAALEGRKITSEESRLAAQLQQQAALEGRQISSQEAIQQAQLQQQAALEGRRITSEESRIAAQLQQQAALEGRQISSQEAIQQAQLQQQAMLANQDAINKLNAQRAELTLRAQQGDQQAATELQKVQAQLDTEVNVDNARRVDDMRKQAASLEMQARMGNQQAALDLQKLNLTMQADLQKFNISQENELKKFDVETQTRYQAMENDLVKYYTELGYNAEQAKIKTMMDIAGQQIEAQKVQLAGVGQVMQGIGGLGTAIAGVAAFSDVNVKTNIKTTSMLRDLAGAKPYEYEYKSTEFGAPGKHQSLMAQDIEKIPFLQKVVLETPRGKMVDYGKALPSMLAAQAEMAREILELKRKRGR